MSSGGRQRVVVLVGLPGSGKSTWLAQQGAVGISSDELRRLLKDDATDQTIHRIVFRLVRQLLRIRIALGLKATYIDATNLTPRERRPYIKIAQTYGCDVEAVFFDVPAAVCRERNLARSRIVPEEAMEKLAARLAPPDVREGFSWVTVVSATDAAAPSPGRPASGAR